MVERMRTARLLALIAWSAAAAGCFQLTTRVTVNGDRSGTIEQRLSVTSAGLAQMAQFSALGRNGQPFDPLSEDAAREAAASLGSGVTVVSSTPFADAAGQGRTTTYAFTDITQVRLPLTPPGMPAGFLERGGPAIITFASSGFEQGDTLLQVTVPQPLAGLGGAGLPPPEQLAMIRSLVAGARVSVVLEPAGTVVQAKAPAVDGNRVTLLDIDADQALQDANLARLKAATTPDDLKAALAATPGLKIPLDGDVSVRFTPK
jgi:hypothetical protein